MRHDPVPMDIAQSGGEAQVIRNDPDLKEESSQSFTLGVEATPPVGSGFGRLELNAFRTVSATSAPGHKDCAKAFASSS